MGHFAGDVRAWLCVGGTGESNHLHVGRFKLPLFPKQFDELSQITAILLTEEHAEAGQSSAHHYVVDGQWLTSTHNNVVDQQTHCGSRGIRQWNRDV